MKKIIIELNYDIEIMDNENEAIEKAEYFWNRMTDKEKEKADYFKVYEVEVDCIEDVADFSEYMTRMIKDFKG